MSDDFKILPDKDDLKLEARMKRREEAERAVKEYETKKRLLELKASLMGGLDMSLAAIFMAKSCISMDPEGMLADRELLKLLNELNDLTEKLVRRMT